VPEKAPRAEKATRAEKSAQGDLEAELSRKVKVAKIRSRPLTRREQQPDQFLEEPKHREAIVGPTALRKRKQDETLGKKKNISFAAEESLAKSFDIVSFAVYKKKLWFIKAGSTLECNQCSVRAPLSLGNLNLYPSRGQFMQERFLCEACCGNVASPEGRPVSNLLLADETQGRSEALNAAMEEEVLARADAKADAPAEAQNGTPSVAASNTQTEESKV
jgi:hypothetical protein